METYFEYSWKPESEDGEKIDSHELTPPLPANQALEHAEDHLAEHLEGYLRRFEQWHGIDRNNP